MLNVILVLFVMSVTSVCPKIARGIACMSMTSASSGIGRGLALMSVTSAGP